MFILLLPLNESESGFFQLYTYLSKQTILFELIIYLKMFVISVVAVLSKIDSNGCDSRNLSRRKIHVPKPKKSHDN